MKKSHPFLVIIFSGVITLVNGLTTIAYANQSDAISSKSRKMPLCVVSIGEGGNKTERPHDFKNYPVKIDDKKHYLVSCKNQ